PATDSHEAPHALRSLYAAEALTRADHRRTRRGRALPAGAGPVRGAHRADARFAVLRAFDSGAVARGAPDPRGASSGDAGGELGGALQFYRPSFSGWRTGILESRTMIIRISRRPFVGVAAAVVMAVIPFTLSRGDDPPQQGRRAPSE